MGFIDSTTGTPGVPPTTQSSFECDMDENFSLPLRWISPNNTGGPGVEIVHYMLNVTEVNGPSYQMNVTDSNTTITGINCSSIYSVSVRAVNCARMGGPLMISVNPSGEWGISQ